MLDPKGALGAILWTFYIYVMVFLLTHGEAFGHWLERLIS